MKTAELRKKYLDFFKEKTHKYFDSDSLVPGDDPTLLFTSAGMNQFKDYFLGKNKSTTRATSCQKCLRTGDLERVGKTAYHHTFFEMLGNFAFGDYFKNEAIAWAWEFVTKECGIDPKDLWVTVYLEDDESAQIWEKDVGVAKDRIVRYGADDNFWPQNALELGLIGPCGPCSEIYFDYGQERGCGSEDCGPACSCGRFVEVWNLVFTQYNCLGKNKTEPLPANNIDTGMGLERMAGVLQGKTTNYDIDILRPIVDALAKELKTEDRFYLNAITDHLRAVTFCILDGVYPSNEDRGYVVRKILRRALWFGFSCGKKEPFLNKYVQIVVDMMKDQYPELEAKQDTIEKVMLAEEERFLATLDKGKEMLFSYIDIAKKENRMSLTGVEVFRLYDTFGFPFELTANIAEENKLQIDVEGFESALESQKEQSRAGSKFEGSVFVSGDLSFDSKTEFVGYDLLNCENAKVTHIIGDSGFVDSAQGGDAVSVTLSSTSLYAAKGGQAHDQGQIVGKGFKFTVTSVDDLDGTSIHKGILEEGNIKEGDIVLTCYDHERRAAITRAHTATHILQAVLRTVLGDHVQQQGSYVDEDYLRFDFNHFQGLTEVELTNVEEFANTVVLANHTVLKEEMTQAQAKEKGALAFFEDKYGDTVRVVTVGDVSTEFCGGTHIKSTSEIGLIVVVTESSVASGIRRIEAYTGKKALSVLKASRQHEQSLCRKLKVQPENLVSAVADLMTIKKLYSKKLENILAEKFEKIDSKEIVEKGKIEISGIDVIVFELKDQSSGFLRKAIDIVRSCCDKNTLIAGVANEGTKLTINISKTKDLKDIDCGKQAATVAEKFSTQGGGKDNFGFCGMKQDSKADYNNVKKLIIEALKEAM